MYRQAWWLTCTIILLSPVTLLGPTAQIVLWFDMLCLIAGLLAVSTKRILIGQRFILSLSLSFLLIAIYLVFQIIPQPPSLLRLFVPETWQAYQETIWVLSPSLWMPISVNMEATLYACFHICALWAFCLAFGLLIEHYDII